LFEIALDSYYNEINPKWPITDKMRLYQRARDAFDQKIPFQTREEHFQFIYNELQSKWSVFRNAQRYMSYKEVFLLLNTDACQACARERITLINCTNQFPSISRCIEMVKTIKTNADGYSVMAFSKFLHFFNPTLFPIYDNQYIGSGMLSKLYNANDYLRFISYIADLFIGLRSILRSRMQHFDEWYKRRLPRQS